MAVSSFVIGVRTEVSFVLTSLRAVNLRCHVSVQLRCHVSVRAVKLMYRVHGTYS